MKILSRCLGALSALALVLVWPLALAAQTYNYAIPLTVEESSGVARTGISVRTTGTAIERLLANSDLRTRLSTRARHLIETEFDIHRNTAHLRTIFQMAEQVGIKAAQEG